MESSWFYSNASWSQPIQRQQFSLISSEQELLLFPLPFLFLFFNLFLGVGKNFDYLCNRVFFCFFFSRPFHENFKFLKNCPYDFQKILHSHSTPKGAPACGKASKSYDWNVRNIPKIGPKMARVSPKTAIFRLFSIRTKFSTVILHHIRVLYVQWHQNRMAGMRET